MLVGKFTSTPSGSSSYLTTLGFEFYEFYTGSSTSLVTQVDTALKNTANTSFQTIG